MRLQEALQQYLLVDRALQTRATYEKFLTKFVTAIGPGRPLELIRPEDLDAYVQEMRHQTTKYESHPKRPTEHDMLAAATIYKRIKMLRAFFTWCVSRGLIDESPARFLTNRRPQQRPGQGKAASPEEVELVIAAARFKPRDLAIVLLLARSGARANEVATLRISQLDLPHCRAVIDGKGDKRRQIFFDEETATAIRAWLAHRPTDAEHSYVFTSTRGHQRLTPQGISQITRRLSELAGLERKLGAHAFRHYVGMTLARHHVAPPVIQAYLGHTSIHTTMGYIAMVADEDLEDAGRLLSQPRQTQKPAPEIRPFPRTG